jgi:hypothetical protein
MSQITTYNTEIRLPPSQLVSVDASIKGSPCQEILRLACDKAARDHRGVVSKTYRDNRGQVHQCLLAVGTSDFPQGIGLRLQRDGRINFCYDAYAGDKEIAEAICRQIRQTYVTIALLRSLQQVGFDLEAREKAISSLDRVIAISGKKWSGERVSIAVDKQGEVGIDFDGYPAQACVRDETALRSALEAQDLRIEVKEKQEKRDGPLAAWRNTDGERISCNE